MPDSRFFEHTGSHTLSEIARVGGCTLSDLSRGDQAMTSVAALHQATNSDVSFLNNPKYLSALKESQAGACIISEKYAKNAPNTMVLLLSENPYVSYAKIAALFYPEPTIKASISKTSHIAKKATIGKGCYIGPGVVIEAGAQIGNGCVIHANSVIGANVIMGDHCLVHASVTITYSIIGHHCVFHSGARIGQEGFGFATDKGQHLTVPQLGRVVIGNYVEIGANSCIDRGAGPDTIIGDGCRLDNLVQIGHNVQLGKGCVIVSQVGMSGSSVCGDYVVLGGQVGVAGHIKIGSMVQVAAQSGVMHTIEPNQMIGGSPAIPVKQWHRQTIAIKQLVNKKDKHD